MCSNSMASAHVILKIKESCQSGRKVVPHDSKSDLPLDYNKNFLYIQDGVI